MGACASSSSATPNPNSLSVMDPTSPKHNSLKSSSSRSMDVSSPRPKQRSKTISILSMPPVDYEEFLDFCEKRMAGENVHFYAAIEEYEGLFAQNASQEEINKAGEAIVLKYLSNKSPSEVFVGHNIRETILEAYEKSEWDKETFKAARSELMSTLMGLMMPAYEEKLARPISTST